MLTWTGSITEVESGAFSQRSLPTSPCFRNSPAAYTEIRPIAARQVMSSTPLPRLSIPVADPTKSTGEQANPTRWTSGLCLNPSPTCPSTLASRRRRRASGRRICNTTDELAAIASGRLLRCLNLLILDSGDGTFSSCCLSLGSSAHWVSRS